MKTSVSSLDCLRSSHCRPLAAGQGLAAAEVAQYLQVLGIWTLAANGGAIERTYAFANYYDTMAFVNALAYVVHREDHHPELVVNYNTCVVRFNTHSTGGISLNDFICAAKVDVIFAQSHA